MKKVLLKKSPKIVNDDLASLEAVNKSVEELTTKIEETKQAISESFSDCVVAFVDLVDSTSFKVSNPESTWILRVKIFVDVISEYATGLGGDVVKVIGDEVMISFTREEQNNDALNFVMRISEIEKALKKATGVPTKIKIALDGGKVCFIKYVGNEAADPQGTPVDRCARISKFCSAGTVLTSESQFLRFEHKDLWKFVGKPNLKGIGPTSVYQLGEATVEAIDQQSLPIDQYNRLIKIAEENQQLIEKNKKLQEQIRAMGRKPEPDAAIDLGEENSWAEIENVIKEIGKLVDGAACSTSQYARFLFLEQIDESEKYNTFEGKTFDDVIQAGLVHSEHDNDWYSVNHSNKRNQKALDKIDELEQLLISYQENYGDINEDELFDHSVKSPEFWAEYIGYHVI